jgi:hypothetical protein
MNAGRRRKRSVSHSNGSRDGVSMQSRSIFTVNEPSGSSRSQARCRKNTSTSLVFGAVALTAVVAGAIILLDADTFLRPFLALWLFAFCPGFPIARWLQVADPLAEIGLSVVISLGITSIVAGLMLYAGFWSLSAATLIITAVCLAGTGAQVIVMKRREQT